MIYATFSEGQEFTNYLKPFVTAQVKKVNFGI